MNQSQCPACHAPIVWLSWPSNPRYAIPADAVTVTSAESVFDVAIHRNHLRVCPMTQPRCARCGMPADGYWLTLTYQVAQNWYHRTVHAVLCWACMKMVDRPPTAEFCFYRLPSSETTEAQG